MSCSISFEYGVRQVQEKSDKHCSDRLSNPPPCCSDRSFAAGLMQLHVVHTFGVYNVVELDGLASLTQLQQLELCIPASLEALQHLHRLSCLSAQVALSLPFCDNLDYEQLSCVTRIKFQVRIAP